MRKIIYCLLVVFVLQACKTYPDLNLEEYKRTWQQNPRYESSEKEINLIKGTRYVSIDLDDEDVIIVTKRDSISPYKLLTFYDKKTYKYMGGGQYFYYFPFGVWKYNYEKDPIKKKQNADKGYTFSVKDLIRKFKREYNIDIENPKNVRTIARTIEPDEKNPARYLVDLAFNY